MVVLFSTFAVAQQDDGLSGKKIEEGSRYSGPALSREELSQCIGQGERLNELDIEIDDLEETASARRAELESNEATLIEAKGVVDASSQSSVDKFNALVDKHGNLADQYNALLMQLNERIAARHEAADLYDSSCAQKAYFDSDLNAIRQAR